MWSLLRQSLTTKHKICLFLLVLAIAFDFVVSALVLFNKLLIDNRNMPGLCVYMCVYSYMKIEDC